MSSHVEQIKERLGIVDIVSSYIKLDKAGTNYKAKCPFHNESTPSFIVSPTRNTFYCFGCGAKGDVFSFVEQFEGTDFKGALKTLAERAGVEITPLNKEKEDKKTRLYSALEEATTFFENTLEEHAEAKNYIKERGISKKSIETWRIGYAPASWTAMLDALQSKGYSEQELLDAGLIKPSPKGVGHYDRFRGRIMFPIMDSSGRVIAYSGRILPSKENLEFKEDSAKYINSPETTFYEKSRVLYGFHIAKNSIRKHDFSIIVEGQMDVVLSHQAGFTNTVAVSGTALTEHQILLLSRLSGNLVMAFDADSAGIAAGGRGIDLALSHGMDVKVAALPVGKDPADLVSEEKEVWRATIRGAKHVVEFYLDHLEEKYDDMRKRRVAVGSTVIPYIAQIPNKLDQAHFVELTATHLGLAQDPIWDSVRNVGRKSVTHGVSEKKQEVQGEGNSRHRTIQNRILGILLVEEKRTDKKSVIDAVALRKELVSIIGEDVLARELENAVSDGDRLLFEIEKLYAEESNLEAEIQDLIQELKREEMRERYTMALSNLKKAEEEGDKKAIASALEECRKLGSSLNI